MRCLQFLEGQQCCPIKKKVSGTTWVYTQVVPFARCKERGADMLSRTKGLRGVRDTVFFRRGVIVWDIRMMSGWINNLE